MEPSSNQITRLLQAWTGGDENALGELTPIVYRELRAMARRYIAGERPGHTLQATALINEAYVPLIDWKNVRWQNRAHFFAVCAGMMRRILVDSARALREGILLQEGCCEQLRASCDRLTALQSRDNRLRELHYSKERMRLEVFPEYAGTIGWTERRCKFFVAPGRENEQADQRLCELDERECPLHPFVKHRLPLFSRRKAQPFVTFHVFWTAKNPRTS